MTWERFTNQDADVRLNSLRYELLYFIDVIVMRWMWYASFVAYKLNFLMLQLSHAMYNFCQMMND